MPDAKKQYDVIVIGAGPAGYVAAMRAAQLGFKVACVDKWKNQAGQASLGGTYINAGCIAVMSLLESAKIYHLLQHDLGKHGIRAENITLDLKQMLSRKEQIVFNLSEQIKQCFAHYDIACIHGHGRLLADKQVEVRTEAKDEKTLLKAAHIILATGSLPIELSCAPLDNRLIIDSTATLNIEQLPKKLGIIGAGIIGLELAGIWNRLGSEVILLDAQEHFLISTDFQISQEAYRIYTEQGLDLRLGARVTATKKLNDHVLLEYQDSQGLHHLELDKLIVAAGRKPNSQKIAAPEAGLLLDENGFVHVDENCCTNLPGVYAIGDLTLLAPMLAHKGLEEGSFVAEYIANQHHPINYDSIPSVIYTEPEIAWVGQTEQVLKTIGTPYKVGVFPFKASGRAQTAAKTDGLVKIISHAETDVILGVHIIGALASELIAEAVLAMEFSASSEDIARTIHAHPSISEALHEAALALDNRSLRMPPL
jgi:dihydrolipoamide dehydrogenase